MYLIHSHVQYLTGFRQDLEKLGTFCKEYNLVNIINATQSFGAFKLFLKNGSCDGLVIGEGEQPLGEDGQPLSRAEQIRQRIAERREELRREQEEQQAQKETQSEAVTESKSVPQNYQNAIRAMMRNNSKDKNSDDKKDG